MRIFQGTPKISIYIFWEGHKKIWKKSSTFLWRYKVLLWPSQVIWTLCQRYVFFQKYLLLIFNHIFFLTSFIEGKNDDKGAKACLATAAGWSIKPLIIPIPSSSFDQKKLLISDHVLSKVFPAFSRNPTSSSNDCRCSALNSSEL